MSRVEEISKRLSEVTPGPWRAKHRCVGCTDADDESCGLGLEIEGPPEASMRGQFALGADARFIAAAPDDIAYLLRQARTLEETERVVRRFLEVSKEVLTPVYGHGVPPPGLLITAAVAHFSAEFEGALGGEGE